MFPIVEELMKTRRELKEAQQQLRILQLNKISSSSDNSDIPVPTISLFVQYNSFFNQLCDFSLTMTIENLLVKLRQLTGISIDCPIRLRVLSEDGLTTLFFVHKELNRTLESYNDCLKARMILNIEDFDDTPQEKRLERSESTTSSKRTHSFDESDV